MFFFIPFELITLPVQFGNTLPQKYGLFGKHNGNTRIWQFDLQEMAWHQPQTGNVGLMQQHSRVVLWTKDAIHTHMCVYIYIYMHTQINQYNSIWFIFDNLLHHYMPIWLQLTIQGLGWRYKDTPTDELRIPGALNRQFRLLILKCIFAYEISMGLKRS